MASAEEQETCPAVADTEKIASRSSSRVPRKITRFDPIKEKTVAPSKLEPQGSGMPLGEIPNVAHMLKKISGSSDLILALHRLLYNTAGKSLQRKVSVKRFNGYVWTEKNNKEKIFKRLEDRRWTVTALKDLCQLLDVGESSNKQVMRENIVKFLEKPEPSGRDILTFASNKRKSTKYGTRKSKKSKSIGKKRAMTAYFHFLKDKRQEIQEENPGIGVKEVSIECGKKWRELTDDQKKPYVDLYLKEKAALANGESATAEGGSATESEVDEEEEATEKQDEENEFLGEEND